MNGLSTDYSFRIDSMHFKGQNDREFTPSKINVIVGPNNSGKSTLLREIRDAILGSGDMNTLLLESMRVPMPSSVQQLEDSYQLSSHIVPYQNGWRINDYCDCGLEPDGDRGPRPKSQHHELSEDWSGHLQSVIDELPASDGDASDLLGEHSQRLSYPLQFLGPLFVTFSGTEQRLSLSYGERHHGEQDYERNTLSDLYRKDPTLERISGDTKELFSRDVIIDSQSYGSMLLLQTSTDFDWWRACRKSESLSINQHNSCRPLYKEGDGMRSFVATMAVLLNSDKPILLIDEPEASLYPMHAYKLGKLLCERLLAMNSLQHAFIVTHSNHLLRGMLSKKDEELSIIRLQNDKGHPLVNTIDSNTITTKLISRADFNPLEIDALFSDAVILVESPQDALIYEAIAQKIGIVGDFIFVPAGGKHGLVPKRNWFKQAQIRTGIICDFDILNDGDELYGLLKSHCIKIGKSDRKRLADATDPLRNSFWTQAEKACVEIEKDALEEDYNKQIKTNYHKLFKRNPLDRIEAELRNEVVKNLDTLLEHNFMVLESGELETIFDQDVSYKHNSKDWLSDALEHIHGSEAPSLMEYREVVRLSKLIRQLVRP